MSQALADQLSTRFYRYLAVTSQSCAASNVLPSTPEQHAMAVMLARNCVRWGFRMW